MKWLIYGAGGWIGGQVCELLIAQGQEVVVAQARADDDVGVGTELDQVQPDRVISLIGRTHGPGYSTIDYLEQKGKLVENVKDNLYAPILLALQCQRRGVHFTYLGTGCIFEYDEAHPMTPGGAGFDEDSQPNFFGSGYSVVKGFTDRLAHHLPMLNIRIRMPITGDRNPRNFITKITSYAKITSIPNSMSVLPTLLPLMVDLASKGETGTINLCNPGVISHNEILELYKEIVDPSFTWQNFSLEEQSQILLAGRSNNFLDTTKLEQFYPSVPSIHTAVKEALLAMR